MDKETIRKAVDQSMPSAREFLARLISFPSTSGKEHELMCWAEGAFAELGVEVSRVEMSNRIKHDPDYSDPIPDLDYTGRFNLRVRLPGSGGGRNLLLNSHTDVVPASQGQENPWEAIERDGVIYGRGACDAKGQVATIYLVLAALKKLGASPAGDLIAHVVVEEENGGNGALAMIRAGEEADGCIVLEPTNNKVYTSVRGAVWFRLLCAGRAVHGSRIGQSISAITLARKAMNVLEEYHANLLARSKGIPLFDKYENPMPCNFNRMWAGDWPSTVPSHAVVEGVLGILPNITRHEVVNELREALDNSGDRQLAERVKLEFMYRHDSHVLDPEHPLVEELMRSSGDWALPVEVDAMVASCDSWSYNNELNIPTVVYGPGNLGHAHSMEEQIALAEIFEAGCMLTDFAARWCG